MYWINIILLTHAAFATDQSLLNSFKTVKEKFQQAQDALDKFENLLNQQTRMKPDGKTTDSLSQHEAPSGLENEHRILSTMNAWERMSSWKRPEKSSDESSKASSKEVEELNRKQLSNLRNMSFGKTTVKIYKDSMNKTTVLSFKIKTDAKFPHFHLMIKVHSTYMKLLPGMCGRGLCFVVEKQGDTCLLVVIIEQMSFNKFINIMIHLSISDTLSLDFSEFNPFPSDRVLTFYFPSFKVRHGDEATIQLTPEEISENLKLTTKIDIDSDSRVIFKDFKFHPPYAYFKHLPSEDITDDVSTYNVSGDAYQSEIHHNTTTPNAKDCIIYVYHKMKLAEDVYIGLQRRYSVYTNIQSKPSFYLKPAIVGQDFLPNNFEAHMPVALYFEVYGVPSAKLLLYKYMNDGRMAFDFPGFEIMITRYAQGEISIVMTSYNLTHEDMGNYVVDARTSNGYVIRKTIELNVFDEKIKMDFFARNKTFDGNERKVVALMCSATGKPRPTIDFVNAMLDDSFHIDAYPKVENSTTFEISPLLISNDTVRRSILIRQFPESYSNVFHIVCKVYNDVDIEYRIEDVYKTDFDMN